MKIFSCPLFPVPSFQEQPKNSPNRMFSGQTSRGHSRGRPGSKTSGRTSKPWKNNHLGADIYDPNADVHDPRQRKEATSKIVKSCHHIFDTFRHFSRRAKIVKKCQKYLRHLTISRGTSFPAPFGGSDNSVPPLVSVKVR